MNSPTQPPEHPTANAGLPPRTPSSSDTPKPIPEPLEDPVVGEGASPEIAELIGEGDEPASWEQVDLPLPDQWAARSLDVDVQHERPAQSRTPDETPGGASHDGAHDPLPDDPGAEDLDPPAEPPADGGEPPRIPVQPEFGEPEPDGVARVVPLPTVVARDDGTTHVEFGTLEFRHQLIPTREEVQRRVDQWRQARPRFASMLADPNADPDLVSAIEGLDAAAEAKNSTAFDARLEDLTRGLPRNVIREDGDGLWEVREGFQDLAMNHKLGDAAYDALPMLDRAKTVATGQALRDTSALTEQLAEKGAAFAARDAFPALSAQMQLDEVVDHAIQSMEEVVDVATPDQAAGLTELIDRLRDERHLGDLVVDAGFELLRAQRFHQAITNRPNIDPELLRQAQRSAEMALRDLKIAAAESREVLETQLLDESSGLIAAPVPTPLERDSVQALAELEAQVDLLDEPGAPEREELVDVVEPEESLVDPALPVMGSDGRPIAVQVATSTLRRPMPDENGVLLISPGSDLTPTPSTDHTIFLRMGGAEAAKDQLLISIGDRIIDWADQERLARGRMLVAESDATELEADHYGEGTVPVRPVLAPNENGQLRQVPVDEKMAALYQTAIPKLLGLQKRVEELADGEGSADQLPLLMEDFVTQSVEMTSNVAGLVTGKARIAMAEDVASTHREFQEGVIGPAELALQAPALALRLDVQLEQGNKLLEQASTVNVRERLQELVHTISAEADEVLHQPRAAAHERIHLGPAEALLTNVVTETRAMERMLTAPTSETETLEPDEIAALRTQLQQLGPRQNPYDRLDPIGAVIDVIDRVTPGQPPSGEQGQAPRIGVPFIPPESPPALTLELPYVQVASYSDLDAQQRRDDFAGGFVRKRRDDAQEEAREDDETPQLFAAHQESIVDLARPPVAIIDQVDHGMRIYALNLMAAEADPPESPSEVHRQNREFTRTLLDEVQRRRHEGQHLNSTPQGAADAVRSLVALRNTAYSASLDTDAATEILAHVADTVHLKYDELGWAPSSETGSHVVSATVAANTAVAVSEGYLEKLEDNLRARIAPPGIFEEGFEAPPFIQTEVDRLSNSLTTALTTVTTLDKNIGERTDASLPAPRRGGYADARNILFRADQTVRDESDDPTWFTERQLRKLSHAVGRARQKLPQNPLGYDASPEAIAAYYLNRGDDPGYGVEPNGPTPGGAPTSDPQQRSEGNVSAPPWAGAAPSAEHVGDAAPSAEDAGPSEPTTESDDRFRPRALRVGVQADTLAAHTHPSSAEMTTNDAPTASAVVATRYPAPRGQSPSRRGRV